MTVDAFDNEVSPEQPVAAYDTHVGNIVILSDAIQRVYAGYREDKVIGPLEFDRYKRQKDLLLKLLEDNVNTACLWSELERHTIRKQFPKGHVFESKTPINKAELVPIKKDK